MLDFLDDNKKFFKLMLCMLILQAVLTIIALTK
jgi:hypothetical protein